MALAIPTDALNGRLPTELRGLSAGAAGAFQAIRSGDWMAAAENQRSAARDWIIYQRAQVPPRLAPEMNRALRRLAGGIDAHHFEQAANAAVDVAQSALDFELRYLPQPVIDLARFRIWGRQTVVEVADRDLGGVRSDVTTMEWIRDRFAQSLARADLTDLDAALVALREAVLDRDLAAVREEAARLLDSPVLRSAAIRG